eukprot:TRINITY_DN2229_c0_g1_i12.p1 TRINITY_DN2229_c0_g1~~TRINITY_DN2229_c0_g1_i12.p1  ORF type:complete len:100 (-),score=14.55 TRINITY_DN2229_c0_g1_i12:109-408(-)
MDGGLISTQMNRMGGIGIERTNTREREKEWIWIWIWFYSLLFVCEDYIHLKDTGLNWLVGEYYPLVLLVGGVVSWLCGSNMVPRKQSEACNLLVCFKNG